MSLKTWKRKKQKLILKLRRIALRDEDPDTAPSSGVTGGGGGVGGGGGREGNSDEKGKELRSRAHARNGEEKVETERENVCCKGTKFRHLAFFYDKGGEAIAKTE